MARGFYGQKYSTYKAANIDINRKMLSEMAINDPAGFAAICETAKKAL